MSEEPDLTQLSQRFLRFAEFEAAGYSPLYERLCRGIAADADLLTLTAACRPGQPEPNLFLAAVHSLLLGGIDHPLARFYASVAGEQAEGGDPVPAFRDFCRRQRECIRDLISTRIVQTNEVGRSACLMPAFAHVAMLTHGPLALIEVGASAGLNLLPDRYAYDYGDLGLAGDPASPVRLRCGVIGGTRPPVEAVPAIGYRIGIDLNPIDVRDTAAVAWLRALVWPEHHERAANLLAAVEVAHRDPPALIAGDGIELLAQLIEGVPEDLPICVFHTFVMNQVTPEGRARFYETLTRYSWQRPIFEVTMFHAQGAMAAALEIGRSVRGEWRRAVLARCHAHGRSLEWLV